MESLGSERRAERMRFVPDEDAIISDREYNLVLGGVVLFGLAVNYYLCGRVGNVYQYISPTMFIVLYLVCAFAGCMMSARSDNPVISFIGYCLVVVPVGLVISTAVYAYGGIDSSVVRQAFFYTLLTTGTMIFAAVCYPEFFSRLQGILLAALVGLVIASVISSFTGFLGGIIPWAGALIFSLYIGYDFYRSQQFPKTVDNAVDCALDIYLDIANLFLYILRILAANSSRRRR